MAIDYHQRRKNAQRNLVHMSEALHATIADLYLDESRLMELVGDLSDNLSSVSPGQEDFLVDVKWAQDLIDTVFGPQGWHNPEEED